MTTALDRLRGMAESARRDSLIATAEADILDRLTRVAEDEDDERLDGALEELADNLREALEQCVDRDDADDIPSTGCATCDAVLDVLPSYIGRSGGVALAVQCAVDAFGTAERERDEARAEVERLRAEVAALQERPTRDELADYARRIQSGEVDDAPDADEPDDGWAPGPWWRVVDDSGLSLRGDGTSYAHVEIPHWMLEHNPEPWRANVSPRPGEHQGESAWFASVSEGARWCERHPHLSHFFASWQGAQPEMADVRAAHNSAPVVGATDAGPDAPALIVEGDAAKDALPESAVPAAPVSTAEQRDGETGVDRPPQPDTVVLNEDGEVVARVSDSDGYRCVGCDEAPFPSRDKWCECFDHGILRAFDAREHDASPTTIDGAVVADMSVSDDLRGPDTEDDR